MIRRAHADFKSKRAIRCLLVLPTTNEVIGGVSLSRLEWGAKRAGALSYWLRQSHRGQAYMRESLDMLVDHAFTDLKLNRIEAEVLADNAPSLRLLAYLKFQHEGTNRKSIKITGQWRDHERYALLNPSKG